MDSYTPLLEKTRVPQPSLQKYAVISIFSKLRSAPKYLDSDSEPGREAISQCLHSTSPAVVDQSVRELCSLVADSKIDISRGFLELQSALEGSTPKFVDLFVKGLGFLVRFGFQRSNGKWSFSSAAETHPFVKILSCRSDAESELVQQVFLFMAKNKQLGMVGICDFLRPFLNYSILRIPFSETSALFARHLISSMASLCCSIPLDALPVLKMLTDSLVYVPLSNSEDFRNFIYFAECMVDAYTVVLRNLAGTGLLIAEAHHCGLELFDKILLISSAGHMHSGLIEPVVEMSKHLLITQKDIGLPYVPKVSSAMLTLFIILVQSELEHDQLSTLKLLHLLLKWKYGDEYVVHRTTCPLSEELLFIFPVISLLSSTSKYVKGAATDVLVLLQKLLVTVLIAPKDKPAIEAGYPSLSTPGSIVFKILQRQWFQDPSLLSFFLNFASSGRTDGKEIHHVSRSWPSQLREYTLWIVDRRKSSLPFSQSQERFVTGMPMLLCAIAGVLVMHEVLGSTALDSLAAIATMDPKPKLLTTLPAPASHSMMIPLVVQTILPMLQKDAKRTLYATAIRLLCQTWETNDRAFGSLQGVLLPKLLTELKSERDICISMAASIRDVCRKNPDRGVDLILSVLACIENKDPIIQALGFQSLAHLCEADVIDFYTVWDVITKHVLDYCADSVLAHSVCLLLRWGSMDAKAHPEVSKNVLQILWSVSLSAHPGLQSQWEKARASSLEALAQYEISYVEQNVQDFKNMSTELLFSEANITVLRALEELQVKVITYEHLTRRRLVKEKRVLGSKIEKLLDVFPQVIFSSGKKSNARELPGAALLCLSFTPKDVNTVRTSRGFRDTHAGYEKALVELASSIQLSRNIFVALISQQSWKSFVRRWLGADILSFDTQVSSVVLDKTAKAASDILKSMIKAAEEVIPRSAENIALAVGALCAVLPPSAHTVKSTASKFLLKWLVQPEHEHRRWSAAISLGLISSCLHVTDHKQKFENITGLVEVMCRSSSTLVRGACGVALGFSCQDLLTRETGKMSETDLLGMIVKALSLVIGQLTQFPSDVLESLSAYFPPSTFGIDVNTTSELSHENSDDFLEDIWGVAGLVLGLASTVGAVYRAGAHGAVLKIKGLIVSWIPHMTTLVQGSASCSRGSEIVLSVGSCLALPIIVEFCQRVELMDDNEVHHLANGYKELISELVSVKKSGTFYQSLLMSSCVGAGNLLACTLNGGLHFIEVEHVKDLLELFRKCYSNPYPPLVHLGGMLGLVNALGAGAGILFDMQPPTSVQTAYDHKESCYLMGPLLSSPTCEQYLTSLMQDIFLVAQNSDDRQLQHYAAWAVSFLRNHLFTKEVVNVDNSSNTDAGGSKSVSQSFADDSSVLKLSSWLMHLTSSGTGNAPHVCTVVTVIRCLSQAPRLPTLNWGAIIRHCMRYEAQVAELFPTDVSLEKGSLREECVKLSLVHANKFDPLLKHFELKLQSCILGHLVDLVKVFSGSRLEKMFDDVCSYCSSFTSYQSYDTNETSLLRISCWKGVYQCLDEASLDSVEYISHIENCMEMLFSLMHVKQLATTVGEHFVEEWSEAVRCFGKARRSWLLNSCRYTITIYLLMHVTQEDLQQRDGQLIEVLKKIQTKAKLVSVGSISLTELGRLKPWILNIQSNVIWDVLVEVVAALQHADGSVKRQWLVDAVEISCVSSYPSTALQFLGLLSGSWSKYLPLLILDQHAVLSDLPVTLSSLLSDVSWGGLEELILPSLFASTERIYNWTTHIARGEDIPPDMQAIDKSESSMAVFLLTVMHSTCASLKHYLPLEKQLLLANMAVS
ncbi:protein RST1-like [Pyrus ussuriensis x Pyrus communis]|uniref:Protein RST1-like n=1 Tax=Pyrus ussuriensis x Pyrus communis TaxID=2448454 RepID=A0A5N5G463_9ROSA|nr:protein RST1-like [Pyrus ussuriensis x Pyrus communis]